jgi:hypothetical protein
MQKQKTIKLLSIISIILLLSSSDTQKNIHNIAYSKNNNFLLWEIKGNGLNTPFLFICTLHLIAAKNHVKKGAL